jgi:tellurium resistance protein TerD
MGVSLSKGGNVSLSKEAPGLTTVRVGLGWDTRVTDGSAFDLDASAFVLGASAKVRSDADFIFYNNKNGADGAVVHQGDNTTGEGEATTRWSMVHLTKLPADATKISFAVTIHDADSRRQNFGMVTNAFIRVVNDTGGSRDRPLRPVGGRLHRNRDGVRRTLPPRRGVEVQGDRPRLRRRPASRSPSRWA